MRDLKIVSVALGVVLSATLAATDVSAQSRRGPGRPAGGGAIGTAAARAGVPRAGRPIVRGHYPSRIAPRVFAPYRGYYGGYRPYYSYPYAYRPGFSLGFYSGYPYRGSYGYPYYYDYPFNYSYPYDYRYSVLPGRGYIAAVPGHGYGGVRLAGAPHNGQVFVDGNYVGRVDDFDGSFQRMNLRSGSHRVEILSPGLTPEVFNVNIIPGQTITYRSRVR